MLPRRSFLTTLGGAALSARAQTTNDPALLTLAEAARRLQAKQVSSVELTEACLKRIETYNPKVNAFITVLRERAMAQARQADAELKAGKVRGPLHGIPIALKDNIDTAGIRTTAASAVFDDRIRARMPKFGGS